jgi:acyl carrier protein
LRPRPNGEGVDVPGDLNHAIRAILTEHGRLSQDVSTLGDDSDLFEVGLSSHASVNVMLALEERFDFEFPERMLRRHTFASIAALESCLHELIGAGS